MAVRENKPRLDNPLGGTTDPAVNAAMGRDPVYGAMARLRSMTPAQRKKAEREKKRNKATFDMPAWLTDSLDILAERYGCPRNEVLAMLAEYGLRAYLNGELDPREIRDVTRSLRFEYKLFVEPDFTVEDVRLFTRYEKKE